MDSEKDGGEKNLLYYYRKFKSPKISYIFNKALALSILCDKCGSEGGKYLKKKYHLRY